MSLPISANTLLPLCKPFRGSLLSRGVEESLQSFGSLPTSETIGATIDVVSFDGTPPPFL